MSVERITAFLVGYIYNLLSTCICYEHVFDIYFRINCTLHNYIKLHYVLYLHLPTPPQTRAEHDMLYHHQNAYLLTVPNLEVQSCFYNLVPYSESCRKCPAFHHLSLFSRRLNHVTIVTVLKFIKLMLQP